jgi:uncharacterized protein (DUF952 family)
MRYIYKVLSQAEWKEATSKGYLNTDLDVEDGFIHFSTSRQLALTIRSYFNQYKKIVLLQIETNKRLDWFLKNLVLKSERASFLICMVN